jgi:hypothetical protein
MKEAGLALSTATAIVVLIVWVLVLPSAASIDSQPTKPGTLQLEWQRFLPGISGQKIITTSDGGYVTLGVDASVQTVDGQPEFVNQISVLVKTDLLGNVIWQKTYQIQGATVDLNDVVQTTDGGYALGGTITYPPEPFMSPLAQYCLIKTDAQGSMLWSKNYTSPIKEGSTSFNNLLQISNGGYILIGTYAGWAPSPSELFFIKVDSSGNLVLTKTIGVGWTVSLVPASDGGYVMFESYFRGGGGATFGPVKVDDVGNVLWKTEYKQQDSVSSYGICGIAASDGGYLVGGRAILDNQDHGWVYKTDSRGEMQWNKTYYDASEIYSVAQLHDGGYVMAGATNQSLNYYGEGSAWIAKINEYGDLEAEGKAGATSVSRDFSTIPPWIYSYVSWVLEASDGGFVCVGRWNQTYDASPDQKFWLAKFSASIIPPTYYYMTLSTSPASATLGSPVNISGRLFDSSRRALQNKTVVLTYTFEGYSSWIPISSTVTNGAGAYSILWTNTATGTFTIKTEWLGNATISTLTNTSSLSVLPYDSISVFYIGSNGNISDLSYNNSNRMLGFSVSGASGTTGYVQVMVPKTLAGDGSGISVFLDGVSQNYSLASSGNALVITLNYSHSIHAVMVSFGSQIPEFPSLLVLFPFLTVAALVGIGISKKRTDVKGAKPKPVGTRLLWGLLS